MRIEKIEPGGGLLVSLLPNDCLRLADACRAAAQAADDDRQQYALGHIYDTFAATLEGYALAGAAPMLMRESGMALYTVEDVRRDWLHMADAPIGGAE